MKKVTLKKLKKLIDERMNYISYECNKRGFAGSIIKANLNEIDELLNNMFEELMYSEAGDNKECGMKKNS